MRVIRFSQSYFHWVRKVIFVLHAWTEKMPQAILIAPVIESLNCQCLFQWWCWVTWAVNLNLFRWPKVFWYAEMWLSQLITSNQVYADLHRSVEHVLIWIENVTEAIECQHWCKHRSGLLLIAEVLLLQPLHSRVTLRSFRVAHFGYHPNVIFVIFADVNQSVKVAIRTSHLNRLKTQLLSVIVTLTTVEATLVSQVDV